jgi:thiol:disulfide interchange protein DsbD
MGVESMEYSKEKLDELVKEGKPVFVDATAAWCITCQVNARVALHTDATMKLFKEKGITLMIADWTKRNDAITAFLDSFGYKGVPLCVYYPPGGKKPVVLPQILTESIVINTIQGE